MLISGIPKFIKFFKTPYSPGLLEGLSNPNQLNSLVHKSEVNGLWIVPGGKGILNASFPVDVLSSELLGPVMEKIKENFDVVLIKAPPALSALEASVIEENCEGILFVIEAGLHDKKIVQEAIEKITSFQPELKSPGLFRRKNDKINERSNESEKKTKMLALVLNKVKTIHHADYRKKYQYNLRRSSSGISSIRKWGWASYFLGVFNHSFISYPCFSFTELSFKLYWG